MSANDPSTKDSTHKPSSGVSHGRRSERPAEPEAQVRSGGQIHADPGKPPVNKFGEPPTHAPDLADNPPGSDARRRMNPTPVNITEVTDVKEAIEKIRVAEKADVLYLWNAQEKASASPRQEVIDAIKARLMDVQGPPLPPEIG